MSHPLDSAADPPLLLLVEHDEGVRRSLELLLGARGFAVHAHQTAAAALADPMATAARCLVASYRLADSNGIELLRTLRGTGGQGRAVLLVGNRLPTLVAAALAAGFDAVLEKPMRPDELIAALSP